MWLPSDTTTMKERIIMMTMTQKNTTVSSASHIVAAQALVFQKWSLLSPSSRVGARPALTTAAGLERLACENIRSFF